MEYLIFNQVNATKLLHTAQVGKKGHEGIFVLDSTRLYEYT